MRNSHGIIVPEGDKGRPIVAAGGLYAPTIRYRDGTFYIVCTNVHHGVQDPQPPPNFIVSTRDVWSDQWSDPVHFDFSGIDPSLFWDDDGRVYIQGSRAPGPNTKIHQFEIDIKTGQKLSEEKKIWDGTGATWPEGPHMYKRDGWYYLLVSEGGCWEEHMITVARSKNIWGPYESFSNNPILTAFGEPRYIQHTGHADMFEDVEGRFWAVCLAVRKDGSGRHNLGRETFLTSAAWPQGDWPRIDSIESNSVGLSPAKSSLTARTMKDYLYIRDPDLDKYQITNGANTIILTTSPIDMTHKNDSPTFVGKRQRELEGKTAVTMFFGSGSWQGSTKAGLASYKDEYRFLRIFYDASEASVVFEVANKAKNIHTTSKHKVAPKKSLGFQIQYTEQEYRAIYSDDSGSSAEWKLAGTVDTADVTSLDFTGPVNGVFALSEGKAFDIEFQDLVVD